MRCMPTPTTNSSAVWDEFAARDDLWVGIITGAGDERSRPATT